MSSAALAPPDVKDVTLALFAGRKSDIAPSDIPEGLTPDEQDGIYVPGEWLSRPGLSRLFAAGALTAGASVLYQKTYTQPNGDPLTLVLTSDGILWVEDTANSPLDPTNLFEVTPGLYAQSVTEFGREYIAFSDLVHGQGIPLQFDGTQFDRVTMDGPGASPTVADYFVDYTVSTSEMEGSQTNVTLSMVGLVATALLPTYGNPVGSILVGDQVQISGASVGGYNGVQTVTAVGMLQGIGYVQFELGATLGPATGATCAFFFAAYIVTTNIPGLAQFTSETVVTVTGNSIAGYNGTFNFRGYAGYTEIFLYVGATGLSNGAGGTLAIGGQSSAGVHQVVMMWLTRQGYISKPSPSAAFFSVGASQWQATALGIGPSNVVARVLGFTGAGGDNFFIIPASITLPNPSIPNGTPITIQSTIVLDNVSTSYTFDVPDNTLFAAVPIDQIGNDLFDQVVLGPVLGFFAYASRLACWGDYNKVENFLNLGFCGGYLSGTLTGPLGWNSAGNQGGTLVNGGPWASGMVWQITGDGSANKKGLLTQSAYQDSFGDAIISPSTQYSYRFWAKSGGLAGTLYLSLTSVSTGFASVASIPVIGLSTAGALTGLIEFGLETPAVIPADLILSLYAIGLANGQTLQVGENEIIFTDDPFRDNLSRWSYVENPEAFAETTGQLGPEDDSAPIRCFALMRQSAMLGTGGGVHIFSDTDSEPDDWTVNQLTRSVSCASLRSFDPGKFGTGDGAEDWLVIAAKNGGYLFAGGEFWKVSQEISRGALPQAQDPRPTWDDANWAAQQTIIAKNHPAKRRAYFALPLNGALTPNKVFVLDYREMDTAAQIAAAPPLHITIQGKMKSSDLTRKWSVWNVFANSIEILERPGNIDDLFFAGAPNALGKSFGNIYSLNPANLADDDYGQIFPYYTTYAFTDHDQEQALGLGSDSKLVKQVHAFITGVGQVVITPIVNSLYNFKPGLSPRILVGDTDPSNFLGDDLEWDIAGLRGDRIFFRVAVFPLPGSINVQVRLQKFIVHMMKDPIAPMRQSAV